MTDGEADDERMTGYDLMAFTDKNVSILIEKIKELRDNNTLTYAKLWHGAGIQKSPSALSRWLNGEATWESIGKTGHEALVRYLIDKKYWYSNQWEDSARAIPDMLFHAVTTYRGIGHATKENIRKRARGVFRVYHPSLILKGRYVVGAARLSAKPDSDAVRVEEYLRYQPEEECRFQFNAIDEAYEGYLFRKSKKYFSLMRDRERSHMRMEMFPDVFGIGREIRMMRGAVMSISENRGFYAPIYYEKIAPKTGEKEDDLFARVKGEANIYHEADLPEIVRAHLNAIPPSLFG